MIYLLLFILLDDQEGWETVHRGGRNRNRPGSGGPHDPHLQDTTAPTGSYGDRRYQHSVSVGSADDKQQINPEGSNLRKWNSNTVQEAGPQSQPSTGRHRVNSQDSEKENEQPLDATSPSYIQQEESLNRKNMSSTITSTPSWTDKQPEGRTSDSAKDISVVPCAVQTPTDPGKPQTPASQFSDSPSGEGYRADEEQEDSEDNEEEEQLATELDDVSCC